MTIDFRVKPTLVGDLVTLRPATQADAAVLHPLMGDREVSRLTGSAHTDAELDTQPWSLERLEEIYGQWSTADDRIVWVIVENATGAVIGESVLSDLDAGNRSCGFRIWISGARGRGLGTEATQLSVKHAIADEGLNRVELEVYDCNPRARHVYETVGFHYEGSRRQALRFNDEWIDAHIMAVIASDWQIR